MQMSEHYSRTKVQQGPTVKKVFGAILGRQNGRQVEAINSFVLKMETEEMAEPVTFSTEHLLQRADQCQFYSVLAHFSFFSPNFRSGSVSRAPSYRSLLCWGG